MEASLLSTVKGREEKTQRTGRWRHTERSIPRRPRTPGVDCSLTACTQGPPVADSKARGRLMFSQDVAVEECFDGDGGRPGLPR